MKELLHRGDMPESLVSFDKPDTDLQIEGRLVGDMAGPMVIGLHGMPGDSGEYIPHSLGQALHAEGFNSLWLDLYNYKVNTRNLTDCTLDTHVDDFGLALDKLAEAGVEDQYAIGHSVGGLVVLMSKVSLKGAVILDGSHGSLWEGLEDKLMEAGDFYVDASGRGAVYQKAMVRQMASLGDTTKLAADKDYPTKYIIAGNGVLTELNKQYLEVANQPKDIHIVEGAGHMFGDSSKVMLEMTGQAVQWFVKIEKGDI